MIAPMAAPRPPPNTPPMMAPVAPPTIAPPTGSCDAASCIGIARAMARQAEDPKARINPALLSFRTAGFLQYGRKVGFPNGAFLDRRQLKPAPGMRCPSSSLHPPFMHFGVNAVIPDAPPWRDITPPRRPRSGSGYSVPIRHHLCDCDPIRPPSSHRDMAKQRRAHDPRPHERAVQGRLADP